MFPTWSSVRCCCVLLTHEQSSAKLLFGKVRTTALRSLCKFEEDRGHGIVASYIRHYLSRWCTASSGRKIPILAASSLQLWPLTMTSAHASPKPTPPWSTLHSSLEKSRHPVRCKSGDRQRQSYNININITIWLQIRDIRHVLPWASAEICPGWGNERNENIFHRGAKQGKVTKETSNLHFMT